MYKEILQLFRCGNNMNAGYVHGQRSDSLTQFYYGSIKGRAALNNSVSSPP